MAAPPDADSTAKGRMSRMNSWATCPPVLFVPMVVLLGLGLPTNLDGQSLELSSATIADWNVAFDAMRAAGATVVHVSFPQWLLDVKGSVLPGDPTEGVRATDRGVPRHAWPGVPQDPGGADQEVAADHLAHPGRWRPESEQATRVRRDPATTPPLPGGTVPAAAVPHGGR